MSTEQPQSQELKIIDEQEQQSPSTPSDPNSKPTESDTLKKSNSNEENALVKTEERYEETPYRWFIVVAYFLLTFANGLQWVTYSSCATNFGLAYNLKSWEVNMFSLIYMIQYPFVCIPEGYLVDAYSTRLGLIISAACTLGGSAFKLLVNQKGGIAWSFVGQFFAGLFQPAILNSPGKIAANWFRENIRTLICTICCIADTIGILVGFVFHAMIIDPDIDIENNPEEYKKDFASYIFWEFILNVIFCVPTFFICKNKPDIPPSPSQVEQEKPGLCESLKLLFTNIRFIFLLISTCFVVGYYCVYGTILNAYLAMYDISDHEASYIYAVSSAVGIVASIVISALLDKFKKFKLFMIILVILGLVFQALFTLLLELSVDNDKLNKFAIGMTLYTLVTAVLIPFYTIGMNYACEITYPVGESINGGIMMSMSQISGIVGTFGCDALMIDYADKKWASNILLLCFFVVASIFVFLFDERLARNEVDQAGLEKKALPEGEAANVEQAPEQEQQQAENEQPQASEP